MVWVLAFGVAGAAPTPPVVDQMHARFDALTAARDAVIQGRLTDAKSAIAPLTKPDPGEAFPPEWRSWLAVVETKAKSVADAKDLQAAATGVAQVALACAQCHDANNGGPLLSSIQDLPPQQWSAGQNMPLHRWATDWMWTGLLANDDGAWKRGADELDTQPLALRFDKAPPSTGQRELEQLVYVIANKALETDPAVDRAILYGNLLATCTQCHLMRGTKP